MTSAPWSVAQRMPRAVADDGQPLSLHTRTGMIRASGAIPAAPSPLSARAAMTPAEP